MTECEHDRYRAAPLRRGAGEWWSQMDDQSVPDEASRADAAAPAPAVPGRVDEVGASPSVPMTGDGRVDASLKLLERLPGLPVSAHPELFEQVHAQLSEVLSELESESAGPSGRPES